ncbi:mechanosensitive ion channel family protein [Geobacter hydrogenophilus]|uniref:Mechanosensitive ion channel protein MscS n=1 Tax=Geobacter hydrogenophilus TaxID=40983 RepID=A0A9W6FWW8_9BACT|nr:mechanosensitive ion channel family protein [Geobacter hydrogenophilus]MBT0895404.1 mechanosensitive ion channel family protein [Geobacter hydrogenophilus]GLI36515.1 mechanosensitive ion channel protein MscS [Geobacter hydrogenophilus]
MRGQQDSGGEAQSSILAGQGHQVAERIEVQPVSSDQAIDRRLTSILKATGWFTEIAVEVDEGVVFLDGVTESVDYRAWAGELAGKTRDVVAVVNRIRVAEKSLWDLSPALVELQALWKRGLQSLPRLGLGLLVLILVGVVTGLMAHGTRRALGRRLNPLLRDVTVRVLSIIVLLIGCYLVLQVAGLSRLAATVLGGTGLAGLVAGIAFRDILENYLASILISIRNPFRIDDLVEIAGHTGVVQRVTTRGTVLMNPDGNHVQIPNATVYKSIIRNYTANPNRREVFEVGIGYENDTSAAQTLALEVLNSHPAVLNDPESLVLVDRLGSSTVNLKAYFWYDGSAFNGLKVKSSLIRLVKRSFEEQGISMPDDAREVLFPEGVPVRMLETAPGTRTSEVEKTPPPPMAGSEAVSGQAEGELASEDRQLRDQARKCRTPEEGINLLTE